MDAIGVIITIVILFGAPILFYILRMLCSFYTVRHKHVSIVERFGKFKKIAEPGVHFLFPGVDKIRPLYWREIEVLHQYGQTRYNVIDTKTYQIPTMETVYDFEPFTFISRDNVPVKVTPTMIYKIVDPVKCVYEIYDLSQALNRLVQTNLRGIVGGMGLDDILASRSELIRSLISKIDRVCLSWGVEITNFHILEISPTVNIQNAMHKQISAERMRRAGIVEAQGRREASRLETEGKSFSSVVSAKAKARVEEIHARGDAQSKTILCKAEADALDIMNEVLEDIDIDVVQYMIGSKYIDTLADTLHNAKVSAVVPIQTDIGGVSRIFSE